MKKYYLLFFLVIFFCRIFAQDTFSIVAIDSLTGEVGSAGASCVDLFNLPGYATDFLGDLIPGIGAINTQAAYIPQNQANARARMLAGDTPQQIINWLAANDAQGNSGTRQYGIAAFVSGSPESAGFTGINCTNYKNHITGPGYSIQGNILLGQLVLDSMQSRFMNEPGDLACKLMAALQGAKMIGADTRCGADGTSSLFAFVKVSQPTDPDGSPSLLVSVKTHDNSGIEPVDSLQVLFDAVHTCSPAGLINETNTSGIVLQQDAATHMLTVKFNAPAGVAWHCTITNVKGVRVYDRSIVSGTQIELNKWTRGVYVLQLSDGTHHDVQKFFRQ